ncbi:MAG: hypothetical protein IKQ60_02450 [Candidatus Methanomethylophilaceae archaeon]|nr:hypothetical protein [Candidatus Methanomethylophilaceae archaeon]
MAWVLVLTAACMCIVAAAMASAAASDVICRQVGDAHWKLVAAVGIPCSAVASLEWSSAAPAVLMAASSAFMAMHVLSERVPSHVSLTISGALAAASFLAAQGGPDGWRLLAPFASSLLFLAMYHMRVLAGGADAKALIALAMVPQYPSLPGVPLLWQAGWPLSAIPLSVSVLVIAVILSLAPMICLGIRNAASGSWGPRMFTEYRMPLDEAERSYVWLVEDVQDGQVVRRRVTEGEREAASRLRDAGIEEVAVTPMVPFVAFIAAGLVVALLIGNPLFAVMRS